MDLSELRQRYQKLGDIPDEVFEAEGFVKIRDFQGAVTVIPKEGYESLSGFCQKTIAQCKGFLFPLHFYAMIDFINKHGCIEWSEVEKVRRRAERLRDEGIPALSDHSFAKKSTMVYNTRRGKVRIPYVFPTLDFLIQFVTGAYERKRKAIAAEMGAAARVKGIKFPIQPATARDIKDFRALAFTEEGRIDPLVVRETYAYVQLHFSVDEESSQKISSIDELAFLYLEEKLRDIKVDKPPFEKWDGNVAVVRERGWYLRFEQSIREDIVRGYVKSLTRVPTKGKDGEVFTFLYSAFPSLFQGLEGLLLKKRKEADQEEIKVLLKKAEEVRNFRNLPREVFSDEPFRSEFVPRLEGYFREMVKELAISNKEALFGNATELSLHLRIPARLAVIPSFKAILDSERLQCARGLSEEDFAKYLPRQRCVSLGHSWSGEELEVSSALRKYLLERYHS